MDQEKQNKNTLEFNGTFVFFLIFIIFSILYFFSVKKQIIDYFKNPNLKINFR